MEIKFGMTACSCLRTLTDQTQTREETQEIRLTEGMPDIGRVLGSWGQPVIRSKEWRSGAMNVSGGVMVWVLYAPEDGSEPRAVEGWIPFQHKWDFEDNGRDGFIWVHPVLKSVDARSISPRKIMVRVNVSTHGQALQTAQEEVFQPDSVPEEVELLRRTYPMELPRECAEKQVQIDEDFSLPNAEGARLMRYSLMPRITEHKILGSRLVFRGCADLHLMYQAGEKLQVWDAEVPFSQFADLDMEVGGAADAWIDPVVTDLELSLTDGKLQLKAAMAAQYMVYDRVNVEVVEDAYSPVRSVEQQRRELLLPARLDRWQQEASPELTLSVEMGTLVDLCTMADAPCCRGEEVILSGSCQMVYYDPAGQLQGASGRFEEKIRSEFARDAAVRCGTDFHEKPKITIHGDGVMVTQPMELDFTVTGRQGVPMVTALELGEVRKPDPGRPSVILRRCATGDLWSLAKESGSTVEAIRSANALEGDPERGRMLLIPIG